jgi:ribosomal protein S27E
MSYFEMSLTVECPFCGNESTEHAEFDMCEADRSGVNSCYFEVECPECFKGFWFNAYCSFDVEVSNILKKKPKEAKP